MGHEKVSIKIEVSIYIYIYQGGERTVSNCRYRNLRYGLMIDMSRIHDNRAIFH